MVAPFLRSDRKEAKDMQTPTISIKQDGGDGYCVINEADFDPDKHELFEAGTAVNLEEPLTREVLAKMKKADVIDLLEAHDAVFDKAAVVAELRDLAASVIFVDIGGE